MKLIGITGPMGSGKDTAYQFLAEFLESRGKTTARRGFADTLKLSAYRCFKPDATLEEAIEWANWLKQSGEIAVLDADSAYMEVASITGRGFLQHYGTEAHRDIFSPDFWVDALLPVDGSRKINENSSDYLSDDPSVTGRWQNNFLGGGRYPSVAVITDVRFPNEAQRVRELGGTIVRIERPSVETEVTHASEQKLEADGYILNDDSLITFRDRVIDFTLRNDLHV